MTPVYQDSARLTFADLDKIARDVQIAYCLGKSNNFDHAFAKAVEQVVLDRCAAQLDALREEVARLTKERDEAREWWGIQDLRVGELVSELAALKAQPTDVDAVMVLADAWVVAAIHAALAANCGNTTLATPNAAREALRAKLAARKD